MVRSRAAQAERDAQAAVAAAQEGAAALRAELDGVRTREYEAKAQFVELQQQLDDAVLARDALTAELEDLRTVAADADDAARRAAQSESALRNELHDLRLAKARPSQAAPEKRAGLATAEEAEFEAMRRRLRGLETDGAPPEDPTPSSTPALPTPEPSALRHVQRQRAAAHEDPEMRAHLERAARARDQGDLPTPREGDETDAERRLRALEEQAFRDAEAERRDEGARMPWGASGDQSPPRVSFSLPPPAPELHIAIPEPADHAVGGMATPGAPLNTQTTIDAAAKYLAQRKVRDAERAETDRQGGRSQPPSLATPAPTAPPLDDDYEDDAHFDAARGRDAGEYAGGDGAYVHLNAPPSVPPPQHVAAYEPAAYGGDGDVDAAFEAMYAATDGRERSEPSSAASSRRPGSSRDGARRPRKSAAAANPYGAPARPSSRGAARPASRGAGKKKASLPRISKGGGDPYRS